MRECLKTWHIQLWSYVCVCLCLSVCTCIWRGRGGGVYDEYGSIVRPCLPPQGTICSLSMHHLLVRVVSTATRGGAGRGGGGLGEVVAWREGLLVWEAGWWWCCPSGSLSFSQGSEWGRQEWIMSPSAEAKRHCSTIFCIIFAKSFLDKDKKK